MNASDPETAIDRQDLVGQRRRGVVDGAGDHERADHLAEHGDGALAIGREKRQRASRSCRGLTGPRTCSTRRERTPHGN
ncbi:hypothetical protein [Saccharopolyspora sp. SCSIO 74807]|uniref:hypothetical protein n=1 Tax=Saccharopolyspora sp. SCSIO 74807 TaxID=3118084 RepID=UPI0030D264D1